MGTYTFTDASNDVYVALVDESGEAVSSIEPGASATLLNAGADFMILSDSGSKAYAATPSADANTAPELADASFSVDENSAEGTVIGMLEATYGAELANPISEYIVLSSSSTAVSVNAAGEVVVMNAEMLDYDAGLTSIELEVVAADSAGNISEPAMVTVEVMNVADEPEEVNPVIDADLGEFTVQENAAEGTVIGTVTATDPDADLTPIATYEVTGSDSISISDTGELMVAGAIDYEQTTSIEVSVTAVDSAGNMSEAVTITIAVTQDPSEDVVAEEPKKKKSSGSLAWLTLLAAPFAFMRRRKQK